MRVLLSSIGRRGYLVKYFKEAVGSNGEVWGGDCSRHASAFCYCDQVVLLPPVTDESYVDEILALCRRFGIDMVVPLIDPELEILAQKRQRFFDEGIMCVVSPLRTIEVGFDKYLTYQFALAAGIPVPLTVLEVAQAEEHLASGRFQWPLVVKPRKGSASANITFCGTMEELRTAHSTCPGPMVQEAVPGEEYGYDVFCDRDYRPISVFCKRKLAMRAGETDKAVSVDTPELIALGVKLARSLDIYGPLDADVKLGADGTPKLLEINPRFGDGYPCSHLCGADFPRKLVAMCRGERLAPQLDKPRPVGVYMFKQDEIIRRSQDAMDAMRDGESFSRSRALRLLFTSVGRRVALLREFRRAANDLGVHMVLHAADCQPTAPALQMADERTLVPPIRTGQYVDSLLAYCRQHGIDAVVPLIDTELRPLSEAQARFAESGVRLVLSSPEVIDIGLDKVRTHDFLLAAGFRTPHILTPAEQATTSFPVFLKPRDGSGSKGACRIDSRQALEYFLSTTQGAIVQEFLEGHEHTVDVFCDFGGRPLCAVPRRRHEVRGGEVSKGQALHDDRIIRESLALARALKGGVGMLTIQCFLTPGGEVVFTEINCRFGGGVPLSIRAGADSPRWLLELLVGREPSVSMNGWQHGLYMLRYDEAVFLLPAELGGGGAGAPTARPDATAGGDGAGNRCAV